MSLKFVTPDTRVVPPNHTFNVLFIGDKSVRKDQRRLSLNGSGEYEDSRVQIVFFFGTKIFPPNKCFTEQSGFGSSPYAAINGILELSQFDDISEQSVFIFCNGVVPSAWREKANVFLFHGDFSKPLEIGQFMTDVVQNELKELFGVRCVLCAVGMTVDAAVQDWLVNFVDANAVTVDHFYEVTTKTDNFFPPLKLCSGGLTIVNATPKQFFIQSEQAKIELSPLVESFVQVEKDRWQGTENIGNFRTEFYQKYLTKQTKKRPREKNPKKSSKIIKLEHCPLIVGDTVVVAGIPGEFTVMSVRLFQVQISNDVENHILHFKHTLKIIKRNGNAFEGDFRRLNRYQVG